MIRYPRTKTCAFVIKNDRCEQKRKLCINPLHHRAVHRKDNKRNLERQRQREMKLNLAREIRANYNPKVHPTYSALGEMYNLSGAVVGKIIRNEIWREPEMAVAA